mmetsp:Transcript_15986/g.40085  ORF Transcript_15986/g.40085 Transcript_15986/m.40085 type:complete len:237 (-) Transcript_15986:227-937(-)
MDFVSPQGRDCIVDRIGRRYSLDVSRSTQSLHASFCRTRASRDSRMFFSRRQVGAECQRRRDASNLGSENRIEQTRLSTRRCAIDLHGQQGRKRRHVGHCWWRGRTSPRLSHWKQKGGGIPAALRSSDECSRRRRGNGVPNECRSGWIFALSTQLVCDWRCRRKTQDMGFGERWSMPPNLCATGIGFRGQHYPHLVAPYCSVCFRSYHQWHGTGMGRSKWKSFTHTDGWSDGGSNQ